MIPTVIYYEFANGRVRFLKERMLIAAGGLMSIVAGGP
jgi:hypothetical protein